MTENYFTTGSDLADPIDQIARSRDLRRLEKLARQQLHAYALAVHHHDAPEVILRHAAAFNRYLAEIKTLDPACLKNFQPIPEGDHLEEIQ